MHIFAVLRMLRIEFIHRAVKFIALSAVATLRSIVSTYIEHNVRWKTIISLQPLNSLCSLKNSQLFW